MGQLWNFKA